MPVAHTCVNRLDLPDYMDREKVRWQRPLPCPPVCLDLHCYCWMSMIVFVHTLRPHHFFLQWLTPSSPPAFDRPWTVVIVRV